MDLKEKVKNLPSTPGVYLMKDSLNTIIYVGKSKNLKSRVGSYFQNSKHHSPKVVKMVKNIKDFEYILTDTEFEAFMLECKLIHEIKPIYNRKMKNPLSYAYIKIDMNEKYPRLELRYESLKDQNTIYFGPYTSKGTVENAIEGINENCKLLCSSSSKKNAPCINYSLGLCMGICIDSSHDEEYMKVINNVLTLLSGSNKCILHEMEEKMLNASEKFDFETAARFRDYITSVNSLLSKEKVIEFTEENRYIVLIEPLSDNLIKVFLIQKNNILFNEKYSLTHENLENLKLTLTQKIKSYYNDTLECSFTKVDKYELDEAQIIYSYINSKSNSSLHAIIDEKWINTKSNKDIHKALSALLSSLF